MLDQVLVHELYFFTNLLEVGLSLGDSPVSPDVYLGDVTTSPCSAFTASRRCSARLTLLGTAGEDSLELALDPVSPLLLVRSLRGMAGETEASPDPENDPKSLASPRRFPGRERRGEPWHSDPVTLWCTGDVPSILSLRGDDDNISDLLRGDPNTTCFGDVEGVVSILEEHPLLEILLLGELNVKVPGEGDNEASLDPQPLLQAEDSSRLAEPIGLVGLCGALSELLGDLVLPLELSKIDFTSVLGDPNTSAVGDTTISGVCWGSCFSSD